jgi:hypothetical protein
MNLTSYYRGFKYFILSIRVVDAQNNVESFFHKLCLESSQRCSDEAIHEDI